MDLGSVKRNLEKKEGTESASLINSMPSQVFDPFILHGLHIDLVERGRLICSMKVPPRLLNTAKSLHGGATASLVDLVGAAAIATVGSPLTGVSVEISVSFLDAAFVDDEIEIEAKVLRVGKSVGVVSVEIRKKKTGKIVAQGRHTKFLAVPSKM
ncbi:hypothetical protein PVL29_027271 [Vitis rotundifolia]|uniref:Thioesterase domain-containing protein n=1 Tax=Vitis rotundifolia TaxID=103349 RepID=A0AA38YIQ9_VITRO|nr:hypothetical protein PVL29_027271 [Vitis rotundifolia]